MRQNIVVYFLLVFAVFLVSSSIQALANKEDPELTTCQHQCRVQQQGDDRQKSECPRDCDRYTLEKRRQEEEHGGGERSRHEGDSERRQDDPSKRHEGGSDRREDPWRRQEGGSEHRRDDPSRRQEGGSERRQEDPSRRQESGSERRDDPSRRQEGGSERRQEDPSRRQESGSERQDDPWRRQEGGTERRQDDPSRRQEGGSEGRRDEPWRRQEGGSERRRDDPWRRHEGSSERRREDPSRRHEGGSDRKDDPWRRQKGSDRRDDPSNRDAPEKALRMCHEQCQRESEDQDSQRKCLSKCQKKQGSSRGDANYFDRRRPEEGRRREEEEYDERRRPEEGRKREEEEYDERRRPEEGRRREKEEYEEEGRYGRPEENNPYVFRDEHFTSQFQTEHGRVRVLQRFSDRSELLRGIDNYRLTILEADPQTFVIPNHFDAEAVFFIVQGKGTISLIRADSEKRESLNVKQGDILRINAGTPLYLINRDTNEKLVIAKLMQPVSTPGHFESFFGAGGENPESFYTTFSNEILEAAFNTKPENLEKLFRGERKEEGVILRASQDQIKALSQHEQGGVWPFKGGESKGTINIFKESPSHSNQYGQLYEVSSKELKDLEDIDVQISFLNLTKNAMVGPTYTSKATKISLVVDGEGYFEMACPHLSSQSGGRQSQRGQRGGRSSQRRGSRGSSETSYQKVSTRLTRGMVVVIPAGHPYVAVASNNQDLKMVCFEVNAKNSYKYALAGKGNVVNKFEKQAKELAFGVSSKEVDEVFKSQDEEFFFPGPQHQERRQHEGRASE